MSYLGTNISAPIDAQTPITGSIAANGTLLQVDTTGYNSISVQISGFWSATVTFQASNDGTNFVNVQGFTFNNYMTSTNIVGDNGIYVFPVIGKYFQVLVSGYVTGTINYTAYLRNQSLSGIGETMLTQPLDDATGIQQTIRFPGFVGTGIQPAKNALPVAIAAEQSVDTIIGGKGYSTSVLTANILNNPDSQQNSIDVSAYHSIALQIISGVGSTPTLAFEGSNDNVTFTAVFLQTSNSLTTTIPVSGITLTASTNLWYQGSIPYRYFRVRISTAAGTGVVTCFATLSSVPYSASDSGSNLNAIGGAAVSATTAQLGMNVVQVGGTTTVTGGVAGTLGVGGNAADGVTSAMNALKMGGFDSSNLMRTIRTDSNGAITPGTDPLRAEQVVPLQIRAEHTTNGQQSIQDLLQEILFELRALNYYTKETPYVLNSGQSLTDEPDSFYNDSQTFSFNKGN